MAFFEKLGKVFENKFVAVMKSDSPDSSSEKKEDYYKGAWEEEGKPKWGLFKVKEGEPGKEDSPGDTDDDESPEPLELIEEEEDFDEEAEEDVINVFFAEDNVIFQSLYRSLLDKTEDMELIGWAMNGIDAVKKIKNLPLRPDVILMDIVMPGKTGISAVKEILEFDPSLKIIMLSMCASKEDIIGAFNAGAIGYLRKEGGLIYIKDAIRQVAAGGVPPMQDSVMAHLLAGLGEEDQERALAEEIEIDEDFTEEEDTDGEEEMDYEELDDEELDDEELEDEELDDEELDDEDWKINWLNI